MELTIKKKKEERKVSHVSQLSECALLVLGWGAIAYIAFATASIQWIAYSIAITYALRVLVLYWQDYTLEYVNTNRKHYWSVAMVIVFSVLYLVIMYNTLITTSNIL